MGSLSRDQVVSSWFGDMASINKLVQLDLALKFCIGRLYRIVPFASRVSLIDNLNLY